jgi:hypothetical protein
MRGKRLLASLVVLAAAGAAAPVSIAVPNGGFEDGGPGTPPTGWHSGIAATASEPAPGYSITIDPDKPKAGRFSVRLESSAGGNADFGTVTSSVDASPYRGRRVRLTGSVRAIPGDDGQVGLWLRIDRPEGAGFFDNMDRRPITSADWADYSIEGDVATDATKLAFGMLLAGHGKAWLDDVRLEDIGPARGTGIRLGWGTRPRKGPMAGDEPPRPLSRQGLTNLHAFARLYGLVRFFHPSDEAAAADWDSLAIAGVAKAESARTPAELSHNLEAVFGPVAPSIQIYVTGKKAKPLPRPREAVSASRWHHIGYGDDPGSIYQSERVAQKAVGPADIDTVILPGGVTARIPTAVWRDSSGATLPHALAAPLPTGKPAGFIPAGFDRTTRLAAIAAAWSMYGQFFPYFDAKQRAAWAGVLDPLLREAAIDHDDLAFRDTLRRLVARLHDGHGSVPYYVPPSGNLPLAWDWVEDQLVVTAAGRDVAGLKRGDVISAIDGLPAAQAVAQRAALESGSPQWTRSRALEQLLSGPVGHPVKLSLGRRTVTLAYRKDANVTDSKPEPIAELSRGLFYVDLDRVSQAGFDARIPDLAKARGLIFDLRGYPKMSPAFVQHFSDKPVKSGHFVSLAFDRPDRPGVFAADGQWTLPPVAPRFTRNVAFITNGGAISYSESILSVVAGNHLAAIVGSPSAGANGNITFFNLPGGYQVTWTGMKVTNADGSRHYLLGIPPTVPARRSIAGIRAGRDELLDRAVRLVKSRMRSD